MLLWAVWQANPHPHTLHPAALWAAPGEIYSSWLWFGAWPVIFHDGVDRAHETAPLEYRQAFFTALALTHVSLPLLVGAGVVVGGGGGDFLSHSNFSPFCIFAFWLMNDDPKQWGRDGIWTVSVASDLLLCNHIKCIWSCHQSIILALDIQKISL